mmetsp:Transcript_8896/g.19564  ORF Transcript_8896/g.19564 Transcript_8896/m.19564 type:complete len:227 (-) Transcript_8896:7-687(-)
MAANAEMMEEFQKLVLEKEQLEKEIKGLQEYLEEDGMPGISGPLVDSEGFPRADLDVYAIRKARNRFACAQTDHVELMKKIEQMLVNIHSGSRVSVPRPSAAPKEDMVDGREDGNERSSDVKLPPPAFAWIDEVSEGSPAQDAGLAVGDRISRFGDVSLDIGDLKACFAAIAQLVPTKAGEALDVLVFRGSPPSKATLSLTPRQWAGRGLLGCHLAPYVEGVTSIP